MELLFHIENKDNWNLHIGLFIMPEWPCLWLSVADDRIVMNMGNWWPRVCNKKQEQLWFHIGQEISAMCMEVHANVFNLLRYWKMTFLTNVKRKDCRSCTQYVNGRFCDYECDYECSFLMFPFLFYSFYLYFILFLHFPNCVHGILFLQK